MNIKAFPLTLIMLLLLSLPCAAVPPTVKVGTYNVSIESVARTLDLTKPADRQACTFFTLVVAGPIDMLAKLLEPVQEPAAHDESGAELALREVRLLSKPSVSEDRGTESRIVMEVWFSAACNTAKLANLAASLLLYEKKDTLRLDFLSVADEPPASQRLEEMLISPNFMGIQEDRSGKTYQVRMNIKILPEMAASGVQWHNEQVELIDSEGQAKAPLSTSRSYQYDDTGQVIGRIIMATFALPAQAPRGVRYRVERLRGVQTLPYQFENLPLP